MDDDSDNSSSPSGSTTSSDSTLVQPKRVTFGIDTTGDKKKNIMDIRKKQGKINDERSQNVEKKTEKDEAKDNKNSRSTRNLINIINRKQKDVQGAKSNRRYKINSDERTGRKKSGFVLTSNDNYHERNKQNDDSNMKDENTNIGDQLKQRGTILTEDVIVKEAHVTFEFNISKTQTKFNIRTATLSLLQKFFSADNSLKVQSKLDNTVWGPDDTVPENDEFEKHFSVKELLYKPNTNRKVLAHVTLFTTEDIQRLKYRPVIWNYIGENNIWIKQDYFATQVTSTPGYLVGIHPRATHKPDLQKTFLTL